MKRAARDGGGRQRLRRRKGRRGKGRTVVAGLVLGERSDERRQPLGEDELEAGNGGAEGGDGEIEQQTDGEVAATPGDARRCRTTAWQSWSSRARASSAGSARRTTRPRATGVRAGRRSAGRSGRAGGCCRSPLQLRSKGGGGGQLVRGRRGRRRRGRRTAEPDGALDVEPALARDIGLHLGLALARELARLSLEELALAPPLVGLGRQREAPELRVGALEPVNLALVRRDRHLEIVRRQLPERDEEGRAAVKRSGRTSCQRMAGRRGERQEGGRTRSSSGRAPAASSAR